MTVEVLSQAERFLRSLERPERIKIERLVKQLERDGRIDSYEKFKHLGGGLWEFKSFQVRLFGGFKPGGRFVVVDGAIKKTSGKVPAFQNAMDAALRRLQATP